MKAIECIKTRRSIRRYKDDPIPEDVIQEILDCGRHAPSAHNRQPWAFVVVKDKKKIEKLSQTHQWAPFVANAQVCIILCCTETQKDLNKSAMHLSVACAAQNMLLTIHNHGLGSCWTYVQDSKGDKVEKKVKKILNIPKHIEVICMLPIGYPDQVRGEKPMKDLEDITHDEKWDKKKEKRSLQNR